MKAFYINTDVDAERRLGMLATCARLHLDCQRVVPPAPGNREVQHCARDSGLKPFECSLVLAHRGILSAISTMGERVLVFEDDARLNARVAPGEARRLLASIQSDFIMGGWCDPSCAHAYAVSPVGARRLLHGGFVSARAPADCLLPHFEWGKAWSDIQQSGGKLLYPHHCPHGYEGDIGLFCQDRSSSHGNAYYLHEYLDLIGSELEP